MIPILSYAEMLRETLPPEDERCSMTEGILNAGRRAARLTKQILAFSRKQVMDMRPINLNALIRDFHGMIIRLLTENIEVRLALYPEAVTVLADRMQIEQIIMNLVVNAKDAMPEGGVLTVETFTSSLEQEKVGKFADDPVPGHYAVLAVHDTGSGIDPEALQHIFEPFFTTKEQAKGTGLGLATVFGIVKQHHGHVWVNSEPGRGTTLKVYLPLFQGGEQAAPKGIQSPASLEGTETVLVVEDDERVRGLVCKALKSHGYTVMSAENAAAGLRMVEAITPGPALHLLLTDVIMPGANGKELQVAMSARFPSLRVLFMSGYTGEVIIRHGLLDA